MSARPPLTRERIITAAVAVADRGGLDAVSMRQVGGELGVEAMSLYHHLRSKDDLLDALADRVFSAITLPVPGGAWRAELASRTSSARDVLRAHPWALGLLESRRRPGPALLRHHDAMLGCLRTHGFSVVLAAHAFSVLDSYVYGFVLTETNLPMEPGEDTETFAAELDLVGDDYPHLAEMISEVVVGRDYAYADEFTYGLDLILDAIADRLASEG